MNQVKGEIYTRGKTIRITEKLQEPFARKQRERAVADRQETFLSITIPGSQGVPKESSLTGFRKICSDEVHQGYCIRISFPFATRPVFLMGPTTTVTRWLGWIRSRAAASSEAGVTCLTLSG